MLLSYLQYSKARVRKQRERDERIKKLPAAYHQSLSDADKTILNTPLSTLINNVRSGIWSPTDVLQAYGRKALAVHAQTNCLTEIFIGDADVWASDVNADSTLKTGPLAGVPVSLKDSIAVAGYDACIGYAAWVGRPVQRDSAIVRLLRDAGALLYVKTAIPTTLLSFESYSGVFGRCTNPHNSSFSPGGSTGGDAALIAAGGARVGLGTDIAGSVRVPAHYSGIYSVRSSVGRFPKSGNVSSNPGIEGVPSTTSPLARTLEDLETFWAAVFQMEPWKYDHSVLRIPWKPVKLPEGKVRFGVMWDDGVVPLSPACRRALQSVVDNLRHKGYDVFDFDPPDPYEGLKVASQLILADGGETVLGPLLPREPNDPGMVSASFWFHLPRFLRIIYIWWVKYIRLDSIYAGFLKALRKKSVAEVYKLVADREKYRALWHEAWNKSGMDFLLTAPNALPAVPHGGMKTGWKVCGYTFLFNLLDYTAGVQPITHVSASLDTMTEATISLATNQIAKEAFAMYDARAMDGLPVGVQLVGRRLEEENVLAGMRLIESIMRENGQGYELLEV